jgi:NAD(P)-dependent dehydrogenase (short-subunit alcohol dehydrogenase family)
MVMIGTDSHKRTHTVVAVDDVGRRLGEKTLATTSDGHLGLVQWAAQWPQVTFALEDCRHLTRRLERDLLAAGHRVVRVPTRLMAGARRGGRQPGKSDPIDAEAVRALVDRVYDQLGRIDVVVSNAGYGLFGAAEELTDDQVDHIIATNLTGSITLIRAAAPPAPGDPARMATRIIDSVDIEPAPCVWSSAPRPSPARWLPAAHASPISRPRPSSLPPPTTQPATSWS